MLAYMGIAEECEAREAEHAYRSKVAECGVRVAD
jgi:hypothetical protein